MLPIPGTASLAHLEENVAAAKLKLTPEEWKAIDAIAGLVSTGAGNQGGMVSPKDLESRSE